MLEYNEPARTFTKEELDEILKELTPKDVEMFFVSMSSKQQDEFLEEMRKHLSKEDWESFCIHLMAFEMMLSGARKKTEAIKENMALFLYDDFNGDTDAREKFFALGMEYSKSRNR